MKATKHHGEKFKNGVVTQKNFKGASPSGRNLPQRKPKLLPFIQILGERQKEDRQSFGTGAGGRLNWEGGSYFSEIFCIPLWCWTHGRIC